MLVASLNVVYPLSQAKALFHMLGRYLRMPLSVDKAQKSLVAQLSVRLSGVPNPTGKRFECRDFGLVKLALHTCLTTNTDPRAEPEARVVSVLLRRPGVSMLLNVLNQASKALLPVSLVGIPQPPRKLLKTLNSLWAQTTGPVLGPLHLDPLTEPESIRFYPLLRNSTVTLAFGKGAKSLESGLPGIDSRLPARS